MKLNLGCGNLPKEGFKNIDISLKAKADEFYDITEGIREEDNSVEEIHCGCMLEQIDSNDDFIFVMNECYRVLKAGRSFNGYVPSSKPEVLHLDPMDKRFFQVKSFEYFDRSCHAWKEFGRNYGFDGWSSHTAEENENGIIHFNLIK